VKISVSSYSYHRYLSEGRLDIFGIIRATAELGFDGIEFSALTYPTLSTVVQPSFEIGRTCADILLKKISQVKTEPVKLEMPYSLEIRESVGQPQFKSAGRTKGGDDTDKHTEIQRFEMPRQEGG